jgi:phospholipid/cholesterol/gamma-HCH transport system permease protein
MPMEPTAESEVDKTYFKINGSESGPLEVLLVGRMDHGSVSEWIRAIPELIEKQTFTKIQVDVGGVSYFDDFGVLTLLAIQRTATKKNAAFSLIHTSPKIDELLSLVNFCNHPSALEIKAKPAPNIIVRLGGTTLDIVQRLRFLFEYLGTVCIGFIQVLKRPRLLRLSDTLIQMEKTGVDAVPIVALISFLLGLIIAFMSAIQLRQFGAGIYVASLVALSMVSELGPIITAIIVAGRSGSAYAAEIGTMKISEEVDALITMGFDPVLFLALPRILAAVLTVPILTLFSDLFAVAGGLTVGVFMLGFTPGSYMSQTLDSLRLVDVVWGIGKSMVFAFLISWVGSLRGFEARGGASAVGNAATSAVVSSIFLIILFDSVFAVIRSY